MKNFNEIEIINDGTITIYDLYGIIRPDIDKTAHEIIHFDARFIIKDHGKERKITNIEYSANAKPVTVPNPSTEKDPLSPRDRLILEYVKSNFSIEKRPRNFKEEELNVKANSIVNGHYCRFERVNGVPMYVSERLLKQSMKIGDLTFSIEDELSPEYIKHLYQWIWNYRSSYGVINMKSNEIERFNFCLCLYSNVQAFIGCKSSTSIRIRDLSKYNKRGNPIYRNWRKIYKDFETQNVIMELE